MNRKVTWRAGCMRVQKKGKTAVEKAVILPTTGGGLS